MKPSLSPADKVSNLQYIPSAIVEVVGNKARSMQTGESGTGPAAADSVAGIVLEVVGRKRHEGDTPVAADGTGAGVGLARVVFAAADTVGVFDRHLEDSFPAARYTRPNLRDT